MFGFDTACALLLAVGGIVAIVGVLFLLFNWQSANENRENTRHRVELSIEIDERCAELHGDNEARFRDCVQRASAANDELPMQNPIDGETYATGIVHVASTGLVVVGALAGLGFAGENVQGDDVARLFDSLNARMQIAADEQAKDKQERAKKEHEISKAKEKNTKKMTVLGAFAALALFFIAKK